MQVSAFEPGDQNSLEARRRLQAIRAGLADGSASSGDFRHALEAMLALPDEESWRWLDELRPAFTYVHARERQQRRRGERAERGAGRAPRGDADDQDPPEACEDPTRRAPRT